VVRLSIDGQRSSAALVMSVAIMRRARFFRPASDARISRTFGLQALLDDDRSGAVHRARRCRKTDLHLVLCWEQNRLEFPCRPAATGAVTPEARTGRRGPDSGPPVEAAIARP